MTESDAIIGLIGMAVIGLVVGLYLGGVFEMSIKLKRRK